MDYKFQVNLGGIIDLLSNHIYSSPQVFVRELLQNAVDAITARALAEPAHRGDILISLPAAGGDSPPRLIFSDNGTGLTEDEIHQFLATIGQTSKRDETGAGRRDFIGQFGIGLLSCFVVSEEIEVLTRSVKPGARAVEWRGRADGTYAVRATDHEMGPGTVVRLLCKRGSEEYFDAEEVRRLAHHYGSLLPYPVRLVAGGAAAALVNDEEPPWQQTFTDARAERASYLDYGRNLFGTDFLDAVPLRSPVGDVRGAAFVLAHQMSLAARKTHRVYLKNMLLSEDAEGLLPDWAFFVKCVVNANDLRPTASRESFYEDDALSSTRDALGRTLRNYLVELAEEDPRRLKQIIELHYLSIKALAAEDDDFFRLFVNWLPFETNMGTKTLTEYRRDTDTVLFAPGRDQFRQIARVAASQGLCVINAAYTYDTDLILKLRDVFPDVRLELVDGKTLSYSFERLTADEDEEVSGFARFAERVLAPLGCAVEVRKFTPGDLPALYTSSDEADFRRSIETTKEVTDSFWSSLLDRLGSSAEGDAEGRLCFNYRNPLVHKVARVGDDTLQRLAVQVLYVQALMLGHRPLSSKEMRLLNEGLSGLLEWGADIVVGGVQ